ncbi:MAG: hypothetical protein A3E74_03840 [Omnitrophica bacterium RIFCSPHIGHO2_12_FULL_44_12]|nr:MAG: hypothetical protein A3E74_03840 [Omnitrophica bacterium RIFCSPHIGHO2_12_FULL_44_12]
MKVRYKDQNGIDRDAVFTDISVEAGIHTKIRDVIDLVKGYPDFNSLVSTYVYMSPVKVSATVTNPLPAGAKLTVYAYGATVEGISLMPVNGSVTAANAVIDANVSLSAGTGAVAAIARPADSIYSMAVISQLPLTSSAGLNFLISDLLNNPRSFFVEADVWDDNTQTIVRSGLPVRFTIQNEPDRNVELPKDYAVILPQNGAGFKIDQGVNLGNFGVRVYIDSADVQNLPPLGPNQVYRVKVSAQGQLPEVRSEAREWVAEGTQLQTGMVLIKDDGARQLYIQEVLKASGTDKVDHILATTHDRSGAQIGTRTSIPMVDLVGKYTVGAGRAEARAASRRVGTGVGRMRVPVVPRVTAGKREVTARPQVSGARQFGRSFRDLLTEKKVTRRAFIAGAAAGVVAIYGCGTTGGLPAPVVDNGTGMSDLGPNHGYTINLNDLNVRTALVSVIANQEKITNDAAAAKLEKVLSRVTQIKVVLDAGLAPGIPYELDGLYAMPQGTATSLPAGKVRFEGNRIKGANELLSSGKMLYDLEKAPSAVLVYETVNDESIDLFALGGHFVNLNWEAVPPNGVRPRVIKLEYWSIEKDDQGNVTDTDHISFFAMTPALVRELENVPGTPEFKGAVTVFEGNHEIDVETVSAQPADRKSVGYKSVHEANDLFIQWLQGKGITTPQYENAVGNFYDDKDGRNIKLGSGAIVEVNSATGEENLIPGAFRLITSVPYKGAFNSLVIQRNVRAAFPQTPDRYLGFAVYVPEGVNQFEVALIPDGNVAPSAPLVFKKGAGGMLDFAEGWNFYVLDAKDFVLHEEGQVPTFQYQFYQAKLDIKQRGLNGQMVQAIFPGAIPSANVQTVRAEVRAKVEGPEALSPFERWGRSASTIFGYRAFDRRLFLTGASAAAVGACTNIPLPMEFPLFPGVDLVSPTARIPWDQTFNDLVERSRVRAGSAYDPFLVIDQPDYYATSDRETRGLDFHEGNAVRVLAPAFKGNKVKAMTRPRVVHDHISFQFYNRFTDDQWNELAFSPGLLDWGSPEIRPALPEVWSPDNYGWSRLNLGTVLDLPTDQEPYAEGFTLSATGYLRLAPTAVVDGIKKMLSYSSSFRYFLQNTGTDLEKTRFPQIREIYLSNTYFENQEEGIRAVITFNGEAFEGVAEVTFRFGFPSEMEITRGVLIPRRDVAPGEIRIGGFSSMFWKSEPNASAHDIDKIIAVGEGGVTSFSPYNPGQNIFPEIIRNPTAYYLEQQNRNRADYQAYDNARYDLRANTGVTGIVVAYEDGTPVQHAFDVYIQPTISEGDDNVAGGIRIDDALAKGRPVYFRLKVGAYGDSVEASLIPRRSEVRQAAVAQASINEKIQPTSAEIARARGVRGKNIPARSTAVFDVPKPTTGVPTLRRPGERFVRSEARLLGNVDRFRSVIEKLDQGVREAEVAEVERVVGELHQANVPVTGITVDENIIKNVLITPEGEFPKLAGILATVAKIPALLGRLLKVNGRQLKIPFELNVTWPGSGVALAETVPTITTNGNPVYQVGLDQLGEMFTSAVTENLISPVLGVKGAEDRIREILAVVNQLSEAERNVLFPVATSSDLKFSREITSSSMLDEDGILWMIANAAVFQQQNVWHKVVIINDDLSPAKAALLKMLSEATKGIGHVTVVDGPITPKLIMKLIQGDEEARQAAGRYAATGKTEAFLEQHTTVVLPQTILEQVVNGKSLVDRISQRLVSILQSFMAPGKRLAGYNLSWAGRVGMNAGFDALLKQPDDREEFTPNLGGYRGLTGRQSDAFAQLWDRVKASIAVSISA